MGEQPPGSSPPKIIFTIQLTYLPSKMRFLFLIEAESDKEAWDTFYSLGYSVRDKKFFDLRLNKATLLECHDYRSSTHTSSPLARKQGA
jgi:hypothetical protein